MRRAGTFPNWKTRRQSYVAKLRGIASMRLSSGDKLDARLAPVEGAGLGDCSRIVGNWEVIRVASVLPVIQE